MGYPQCLRGTYFSHKNAYSGFFYFTERLFERGARLKLVFAAKQLANNSTQLNNSKEFAFFNGK